MRTTVTRTVLVLVLLAGTAPYAQAQVALQGGQTVTWQLNDVLRPYDNNPVPWGDIAYTIRTPQGITYMGNHSPDGTPNSTLARGKASVAVVDSITLDIYNDRDQNRVPDSWDSANPAYLHFAKSFALVEGGNDLGEILMFTDRVNDYVTNFQYNLTGSEVNLADLEIEMLMNGIFANPVGSVGQGVKKFFTKTEGWVEDPYSLSTQVPFHWTTPEELERAFIVQAEFASNPTDGSHDFSSLPDAIQVVPYTGDLPEMENFDFQLVLAPDTDPQVSGDIGMNNISERYIKINRAVGDPQFLARGLRVEMKKAYNLTGGFAGNPIETTDSMRRTIRLYQALADGVPYRTMDFSYYSIDQPTSTPPTKPTAVLSQNTPNPFNPRTTIEYTLTSQSPVSIRVYSLSGRHVATVLDETQAEGTYTIPWYGTDATGSLVASGTYFYELVTDGYRQTRKMVLVR